ncbi:MAG TPA: hypothetical protein VFP86_04255 [bacterium]|nr:hypothetical protein [bacterium]
MASLLTQFLIPCLATGVVFAVLATWLLTRKGDTISDALKAEKFADAQAIRLEILDKIKLTSTVPAVGFYVTAAIVALAIPLLLVWGFISEESNTTVVELAGFIEKPANAEKPFQNLNVELPNGVDPDTGSFRIPLPYVNRPSRFNIAGGMFEPVTIEVTINKVSIPAQVTVSFPTIPKRPPLGPIALDHGSAEITTISLPLRRSPTDTSPEIVSSNGSQSPPLFPNAGTPPGIQAGMEQ